MDAAELTALKAKYQLLISGGAPRVVYDGNTGDRVEYTAANASALLSFIQVYDPAYLSAPSRVSRPVRFVF